uniref:Uncharacterized protein n=1 Tax=Ixodes ricinus TaxID=34613 RepID=A0A6B0UJF3_IXORI
MRAGVDEIFGSMLIHKMPVTDIFCLFSLLTSKDVNIHSIRLKNGKLYPIIPYLSPGYDMMVTQARVHVYCLLAKRRMSAVVLRTRQPDMGFASWASESGTKRLERLPQGF